MIRAVAALAMASPAWPAFRAALSPGLRRASPHLAVRLIAAFIGASIVIVATAAIAPLPVVAALAATALCLALVEAWLSRAGRGVSNGLPPGSLGLLPLGPWREQGFYAEQARRYGPVFKARQIVRPLACIADLQTGRKLIKDADETLVAPPLPFNRFVPGDYLRYRDAAGHAHYKGIFRAAFSREVVLAQEAALHVGFRSAFAAAAAEGAEGVPPRARVNTILFPIWAGLYAGLEPDAPETLRLRELSHVIDTRNPRFISDRYVRAAAAEMSGIFQAQAARLGERPQSAAQRCFVGEIHRHDPSALDDPAVLGNLAFLFHVTWADVSGLLTWIARMLADHPAVVRAARAELASAGRDASGRDALCTRIVLETLRLEQSEHIYRRTTRAVSVGDATIPAGWIVRVGVHEAHRDAAVFERPDAFDPDRFLGRSYSKDEYSPFGAHRLACLGEQVTLAVARIFTEELTAGFDLETTNDGLVELGSWGHWAPSRRWRLALTPVAPGSGA